MESAGAPRFVVATRVRAGRDSDFEDCMREVVVPAAVRARPHLVGEWHLLRPATDAREGLASAWLMTLHGPTSWDDWLLQPLFEGAYGAEASREHLKYVEDMVDGEQTVYALDGEVPF